MIRRLVTLLFVLLSAVSLGGQIRLRFAVIEPNEVNPAPGLTISGPTSLDTWSVSGRSQTVDALATDNVAVTSVTYACTGNTTVSGSATLVIGTALSGTWRFSLTLGASDGNTDCSVTAHDGVNDSPIDTIRFVYSAPDVTAPVVTICPSSTCSFTTNGADYITGSGTATLTGTGSDAVGISGAVTWSNAQTAGGGSCTGQTNWTCSASLQSGPNDITVRACDAAGNCGTDTIRATLTITISINQTSIPNKTSGQAGSVVLDATGGAGGNVWTNVVGGTTVNDADADCAGVTLADEGETARVSWTSAVVDGVCSFQARVTDSGANTDTNSLSITFVTAGSEAAYDYYTYMSGLIESTGMPKSRLRTESDKSAFVSSTSPTTWASSWTCDYASDTYNDKQDACKRLLAPAQVSAPSTRVNFTQSGAGTKILIGFDEWKGPEYRSKSICTPTGVIQVDQAGQVFNFKSKRADFQIAGQTGSAAHQNLILQFQEGYTGSNNTPNSGDCIRISNDGARTLNTPVPGGAQSNANQWKPNGTTECYGAGTVAKPVWTSHSVWVRHIYEIQLNVSEAAFTGWNAACGVTIAAGTYHMISEWLISEGGPVQRVIYQAPLSRVFSSFTLDQLAQFYMTEDSTSTNPNPATGLVLVSGVAGTPIPTGTAMRTGAVGAQCNNVNLCFTVQSPGGTIQADGTVTVQVKSGGSSSGPVANLSDGTALILSTPNANVTSIAAAGAFTGGTYLFSDNVVSYFRGFWSLLNFSLPATPEDNMDVFKAPVR